MVGPWKVPVTKQDDKGGWNVQRGSLSQTLGVAQGSNNSITRSWPSPTHSMYQNFLQWASMFVSHMASFPFCLAIVSHYFYKEPPLIFSLPVVRLGLLSWIQRWLFDPGLGKGNSRNLAWVISGGVGTFSKLFCGELSLAFLLDQLGYFLSH